MADDREVKILFTGDTTGLTAALAQAGDVGKTLTNVQNTLAASASEVSSAYVRLKSSLDPAYAASIKLDGACKVVNAELKAGTISNAEYAATAGQISDALGTQSAALTRNAASLRAAQQIKERSAALEASQVAATDAAASAEMTALGRLMTEYRAMEAIKVRSAALEVAQVTATEASATAQVAALGRMMAEYRTLEAVKARSLALEAAQAAAAEASSAAQIASLAGLMSAYRATETIKTNSLALEAAQAAAAEASATAQIGSLGALMAEYQRAEAIKARSMALEEAQAAATAALHTTEMANLRALTAEYQRAQAIKTNSLALEQRQIAALDAVAAAQGRVVTSSSAAADRLADYGAKISRGEQLTRQYNVALEKLRTDAAAAGLSEAALAAEVAKLDAGLAAGMLNIEKYAGHAHSGITSILREMIVVAHEAFTGRFSRIPGSLMVLAEYSTRAAASFLPMAIAIGVVAFAVYEAIAAFERWEVAINRAMAGVKAQTGGGGFSREMFAGFITELDHMAGISRVAAEEVVVSLSHIRDATPAMMRDAIAGMEGFIEVTGEKAPEAAKSLAEAMKNPVEAMSSWIDKGMALDAQTLLNVNTLQQLGKMSEASALALKAWGVAGQKAAEDLTPVKKATTDFENAVLDLGGSFGLGRSASTLWASTLGLLAEALRLLTPIAQALGVVLREVFDAISIVFNAFTIVGAYIEGGLKGAFQQLVDNVKAIKAAARGDFSEAADLIAGKSKEMADIYVAMGKRVETAAKTMGKAARDAAFMAPEAEPHGTARDAEKNSQAATDIENARYIIELTAKYASQKRNLVIITQQMFATDNEINRIAALMTTAHGADLDVLERQLGILVEMRQNENAAYNETLHREQPAPKGQATQLEQFKTELAEEKNLTSEFHEFSNAQEAEFWRNKLKLATGGSKEIAEITKLMNDADRKGKEDDLRDRLDKLKIELEAVNKSFTEKKAILAQYTELADQSYAAGSKAYVASKQFEVKELARIEAEKLALVLKGIDNQNKAEERRTAQIGQALDAQVKLGSLSADEAMTKKNAINDSLLAGEVARIQAEIDATDIGETVKAGLQEKLVVATDKYNASILQSAEKMLEQEQSEYKQTFARISGTISTAFSDMLKGTMTYSDWMRKIASSIADDFFKSAIDMASDWARSELIRTTETAAQTQARALIASIAHSKDTATIAAQVTAFRVSEANKTAASQTGAIARNGAGESENTGLFGRIGSAIAGWFGLESDKTAETVAGAELRTDAELAATIASRAIAVSAGMAQISIDAAVAAAGAMAATSLIPFIGPELAPEVAAATYGETMGWAAGMGGGVALATGAWNIPATMQATLHAGEAVVPANFASGLRQSGLLDGAGGVASGAGGASGGDTYHLTIQALDTQSGANFIMQNARAIVTALRGQMRNGAAMATG